MSDQMSDTDPRPQPEVKTIQLPPVDELKSKLSEAKFTTLNPITTKFFNDFAERLGGKTSTADAFNLQWEISKNEILRDEMPVLVASVDMSFDRIIDVLVGDPQFAQQIKDIRKEFLEFKKGQ